MVIADADLTPGWWPSRSAGLLDRPAAAGGDDGGRRAVGHRDAAQQVAQVALDVARQARRAGQRPR